MSSVGRRGILVGLLCAVLFSHSVFAAQPWSWWKRAGCGVVLSLPLAAGLGWYLYHRQDAQNPIVAENYPWQPPPVIPQTGDTPFMAPGQEEAVFQVHDGHGNYPVMTFFGKTRLQRTIASTINKTAMENEKDPELRKKHQVTPYLRLAYEGIAFKRVAGDPNRVTVHLIGEIYETPLPESYDLRDLAAGKPVTLRLDVPRQSYLGLGHGSGGTSLEVEYDARLGVLKIGRIHAFLKVESLFGNTEDEVEVARMAATRGKPVPRRPILTPKDVNK